MIPPTGPWTPNDLAKLYRLVPRGMRLAELFIQALKLGQLGRARTILSTLNLSFTNLKAEEASLLARYILSELPACMASLAAAGLTDAAAVIVQGAVALASSALMVMLLFIVISAALMSHPESAMALPMPKRESKPGAGTQPVPQGQGGPGQHPGSRHGAGDQTGSGQNAGQGASGAGTASGNAWARTLRGLLEQLGADNPVHEARKVAASLRKQDLCLCSKQQHAQVTPLGPNFASQQLAFQSVPSFPNFGQAPGGGTGSNGSSSASQQRGGGGGGRPNPFEFPQRGGVPLPAPGKTGKPSQTLPDARPKGQCLFPLCQQLGPAAG